MVNNHAHGGLQACWPDADSTKILLHCTDPTKINQCTRTFSFSTAWSWCVTKRLFTLSPLFSPSTSYLARSQSLTILAFRWCLVEWKVGKYTVANCVEKRVCEGRESAYNVFAYASVARSETGTYGYPVTSLWFSASSRLVANRVLFALARETPRAPSPLASG